MMNRGVAPSEIEVTTMGPGFGECTVIHFGSNRWIIVDSCLDETDGEPAPLNYLKGLNVPFENVDLIVATHWHDDHVRGLAKVVERCTNATICLSSSLTNTEFAQFISAHQKKNPHDLSTTGTSEISAVFNQLPRRSKKPKRVTADKRVMQVPGEILAHGLPVEAWTLSPSDSEIERFLMSVGRYMPTKGDTKYRAPRIQENDTSVVLWVSIGDHCILLGADLEQTRQGWGNIVSSKERPQHKASIFKIPHHGSPNGHHEQVWAEMLTPSPVCLLAPYNRGRKLPQTADVERILQRAPESFSTQKLSLKSKKLTRDRDKEKLLASSGKPIRLIKNSAGLIRARMSIPTSIQWDIELFKGACHLSDIHTEI